MKEPHRDALLWKRHAWPLLQVDLSIWAGVFISRDSASIACFGGQLRQWSFVNTGFLSKHYFQKASSQILWHLGTFRVAILSKTGLSQACWQTTAPEVLTTTSQDSASVMILNRGHFNTGELRKMSRSPESKDRRTTLAADKANPITSIILMEGRENEEKGSD